MTKEKQHKKGEIKRKFKPTYIALKNKITVFIITFLIAAFGLISYFQMPREVMPEIVIPNIFIQTVYPGNSPIDIENFITRPIEKELKGLKGVKKISSASYQDVSIVIVEFNTNIEIKQALQDTKDRVDKAKSELPDDLEIDPLVMDLDFSEFPIMNINLSGDYSMKELKKYAELMQEEFEGLQEVSEAKISGIEEREIQINVDPYKLDAVGMSFNDIAAAVQFENLTIGGGEFTADNTRRTIRIVADYKNVDQIANTIIKEVEGKVVYIRDVAEVVNGYKEQSTIARLNKKPVVSLGITKKSGENVLNASKNVKSTIEQLKENNSLPKGLNVVVTDDMSYFVEDTIANLENSIILGMILVTFILFLFLGFRNALFSGLAIPISMFLSFIVLSQAGVTLNSMVLYSLILALGMLVDNAIVVVENVYRLYSHGYTLLHAAKKGVSEIAMPIIASTATTLAAFFPLLIWEGVTGQFMSIFPKTLIVVLSSSLFVALIINPAFIARYMKIDDINRKIKLKRTLINSAIFAALSIPFYLFGIYWIANILMVIALILIFNYFTLRPLARWFQNRFLVWFEKIYTQQLRFALTGKRPILFFAGTILLLIFSTAFYFGSNPKVVFFPDTDPNNIYVTMELPLGTSIEKTNEVTDKVEKIVWETLKPVMPIVKSINTTVGKGKGNMFDSNNNPHKSLTSISFVEYKFRKDVNTSKIMQELTNNFEGFAGAKIFVDKDDNGPPTGAPINIEISGDEFDELIRISDDFLKTIQDDKIAGIDELKLNIDINQPEMLLNIDREKTRRYGLSTQQVAMQIRNALFGLKAGKFKDGEDEYDIYIRLKKQFRNDVSTLMNQNLVIDRGGKIPIISVANYDYSTTYDKITRINNKRVVTISSNVVKGYNANEINTRIRQVLKDYKMPHGYSYKFTGEQQEQQESGQFLLFAMLIAVSLITLIMVTQFNSFSKPLIIIFTVIFSTIGVFLGLAIFQMEFVVIMTGLGIISLAGIVVNNGIVLVDYIDLKLKDIKEENNIEEDYNISKQEQVDALVEAGKTRLRPVLLTAITTVLGLIPLAVGLNINFFSLFSNFDPEITLGGDSVAFWGPMSWTVIFGLTFATILTLVIAPTMYMLLLRGQYHFSRLKSKFTKKSEEVLG